MKKKFLKIIGVALATYCAAYGVVRWRKLIVMRQYDAKEIRMIVRETSPGWDVRTDARGRMKNRINPVVFAVFRPLCAIENGMRGGKRTASS